MLRPASFRAMRPTRICSLTAAAALLWACGPAPGAQPQRLSTLPKPSQPAAAPADRRIEQGLAAAESALQRGQVAMAEAELRLLETEPGTPDQQARYALLVAETLIAAGRPHDAERWLMRRTDALPPALRARHAAALRRAAETPRDSTPPAVAPPAAAAPSSSLVVALLPRSGRWASAAAAIQDGMLRAYFETPSEQRARLRFPRIDDAPEGAMTATQQALTGAARGIIGPLDKALIERVAARISPDVPMLALNHIDRARPGLFQFALAPEDEARIVAEQALALGHRNAWVIVSADEWGDRHRAAFQERFLFGGGRIHTATRYDPKRTDFQDVLRAGLQRSSEVDMLFLAATPSAAAALCPQLRFLGAGTLPIYATSAINSEALSAVGRDLEGINFPDLPWLIDTPIAPRGATPSLRLQAFGIDAYRLWRKIQNHEGPGLQLTGATGELRVDTDGRLHRMALPWAHIAQGEIKAGLARSASGAASRQP